MSNPLDKKIKESLENFEMPYDANAWVAFEKQLPPSAGGATGSSALSWKPAALITVLVASVATIWYLNTDNGNQQTESTTTSIPELTQETAASETEPTFEESKTAVTEQATTKTTRMETLPPTDVRSTAQKMAENRKNETVAEKRVDRSEILETEKKTVIPAGNSPVSNSESAPLIASFIPTMETICVGDEVSFINQSSDTNAKMTWDFGDGTSSNELEPAHAFVLPGNYTVTLKAEKGAKVSQQTVMVKVNSVPTAILDVSQKLAGYDAIPFYHFETILQPNETATWQFSDGSMAKGASADHLFRDAGKAQAILTVKNAAGCAFSDSWELQIPKSFDQLMAPTAFTPDGDGNNDVFIPRALPETGVAFEMVITDLKGQEVYRTSSANDPWNGNLQNNGTKLDAGTYAWTVVLKEEIVRKKTFSGTITLLR